MVFGSPGSRSPELNHDGRLNGVDRGGRPLTAADAIHGHHRQERTTASAVGRPGARSYEQTDRPRPSRSRSGPGVQHGRDRLDWRLVVHRPADMKKVHLLDGQTFQDGGPQADKHAGDRFSCCYRPYWRHWRRDKNPSKFRPPEPSKSGLLGPGFCCAERHPRKPQAHSA